MTAPIIVAPERQQVVQRSHTSAALQAIGLVIVTGVGMVLPLLIISPLLFTLLTQAVISALLAVAVGLLIRQNGAVSFGHALFFGLSAYGVALAIRHGALPIELGLLLAIALPTVFAFVLGLVIVRVQGVAFGMLTLAVAQAFYELVQRWRELANGDDGLAFTLPDKIFGAPVALVQNPASMFSICWLALMLVITGLSMLARTRFGILTLAIRDNEERARFIGYATTVPRALMFALSAAVAGLAGVLFALYNSFVSPDILHWSFSGAALVMAIIGGTGVLWGPAFGAAIYFFFKNAAGGFTEHWPALIGVTLIVITIFLPRGLSGSLQTLFNRIRRKSK